MEHHGEIPQNNVVVVIPARYASTRLEGKLLLDLEGKPVIVRTLERVRGSKLAGRVIVATDDARIRDAVNAAGGEAIMTSQQHPSGSDRVAEVATGLPPACVIVNVQGDEPLIDPETIDRVAQALINDPSADIATACETFRTREEVADPNAVKVVVDRNGRALYFSRSAIPFDRGDDGASLDISLYRKHTGIYCYRREFLLEFTKKAPTMLETAESLEQLRALENGSIIRVVAAASRSIGVDTEEDLERARRIFAAGSATIRTALPADLPDIARVHVESWRGSFKGIAPQEFLDAMSVEKREKVFSERFADAAYRMLVAEVPERGIVGFIDYGPPDSQNFGFDARIFSFYLIPEFQGMGVGGRLFKRCFDELARDGFCSVCLDTLEISPFRGFYEKHGGRIAARDKHLLGGTEFSTIIYGWDIE